MRRTIDRSLHFILTYALIEICSIAFAIRCLLLWLLQTIFECLAFLSMLFFDTATLTILLMERKINPSI